MAFDAVEYARRARELHVHELARRHGWTIERARSTIRKMELEGAHGFWEIDPIEIWGARR